MISELKKIELRKREREKKTQDLQKLIIAADSNFDNRRAERRNLKKRITPQQKIRDTGVCGQYIENDMLALCLTNYHNQREYSTILVSPKLYCYIIATRIAIFQILDCII